MLIDDATFSAIQIFVGKDHPSGFKKNPNKTNTTNDDATSLFTVMNTCVSRIGSGQLRTWLCQPNRDINELSGRYRMIEWALKEKNAIVLSKFRSALKKIYNTGELYAKLLSSRGKPAIWRAFKRSIYYANSIAQTCLALLRSNTLEVADTIIEDFGNYAHENETLTNVLQHLDIIMDLPESLKTAKFCVRFGLDDELDRNKAKLQALINELEAKTKTELTDLADTVNEVTVHFVSEMGFLIGERIKIPTFFVKFFDIFPF